MERKKEKVKSVGHVAGEMWVLSAKGFVRLKFPRNDPLAFANWKTCIKVHGSERSLVASNGSWMRLICESGLMFPITKNRKARAMARKEYTIEEKFEALWSLRDMSIQAASKKHGVPISRIKAWQKEAGKIRYDYYVKQHEMVAHQMMLVQREMARKLAIIVNVIDTDHVKKAPFNHLISSIGVLIDRILKVNDAKDIEQNHQAVRFEYYDSATGEVSETPPWARTDSEEGESFYSRLMREALRQDGISENFNYGNGISWDEDMVARPNLPDGESSLEGFEEVPDRYDWYSD